MKLTAAEIEAIAALSRLELSEEEKQRYAEQLSAVLDYVEMLNEVDTDGVEETCQVTGLEDVFRDDVVVSCDEETRKALIACFPEKRGDLLKVKAVFEI
ncbi:MAG: Asp-tRNA(Asn)/Glu-tRNA(Gln) amidotransferase subunit GatC [Patescibacteria group bacterium]